MVLVSQFRDDAAPPVTWYENESIRYWANLVAMLLGAVAFLLFVVRPIIYGVSVKTPDANENKLLKTSEEENDEVRNRNVVRRSSTRGRGVSERFIVMASESFAVTRKSKRVRKRPVRLLKKLKRV